MQLGSSNSTLHFALSGVRLKSLFIKHAGCTASPYALVSEPSNHLEALGGDRKGQHSIRINKQWRICFEWPKSADGPENVEIIDYH